MAAIGLRYDHGCDSLTIFPYRGRFFHSLMTVHLNASALLFPFPALDGLQFFHWFPLFRFVLSSDPLISICQEDLAITVHLCKALVLLKMHSESREEMSYGRGE